MDENKLAVIIHVTDRNSVNAVRQMILSLDVPRGINPAATLVQGNRWHAFNEAMHESDAKYKIYIDDRTVLVNRNILGDLIEIFRADPTIGLIGCSGATVLSTNGSSYQSVKRCGKMYLGANRTLFQWSDVDERWREVEAVDGFLLATQYDVDWRDDLFDKNSFGDVAQSLEFRRKGYKCAVARQREPWAWHRAESVSMNEDCRKNFLSEYSSELYPKVQILIPTFNRPQFFPAALESALNQTYRNIEIIISDDSTNEATNAAVRPYLEKDARIKYFRNPGFTAADNGNFLNDYQKQHPEAEYFSWLLDDDLFYPTKIEKMVEVYRNEPTVSLVSSLRHNIDENGRVIGQMEPLHDKTGKLSGESVAKQLLMFTANRIGEPTTVLINKKFLVDEDKKFWRRRPNMLDNPNALGDYSQWLYLLERGDLFWINEVLSARRVHGGQDSQQVGTWVLIYINFAEEVAEFWRRKKFLTTDAELRHTIIVWLTKAASALQRGFLENYKGREMPMMERTITAMTQALYNGGSIKLPSWSKLDRKGN